jgi:SAM-dependent methyltransferase
MTSTQRYFDKHARAFDRVYRAPGPLTYLRCGPRLGRELALSIVAQHPDPAVLDVGCGPGRVAEAVLDAGAARYVGIDFSPHMLALARRRLARYPAAELLEGNFLELDLPGTFDVVVALGLYDYVDDPARAAAWMRARCSATLVASFTRWDWVKGPARHARYRFVHRCRIYDYTEESVGQLLAAAGFPSVEFPYSGPRGFLVVAGVRSARRPRRGSGQ